MGGLRDITGVKVQFLSLSTKRKVIVDMKAHGYLQRGTTRGGKPYFLARATNPQTGDKFARLLSRDDFDLLAAAGVKCKGGKKTRRATKTRRSTKSKCNRYKSGKPRTRKSCKRHKKSCTWRKGSRRSGRRGYCRSRN